MIKRYNCFSEDLYQYALSEGVEQTKDGILHFQPQELFVITRNTFLCLN